jgi:hypothetical protein
MLFKIQLIIGGVIGVVFFLFGLASVFSGIQGKGPGLFMGAMFLLVSSISLATLFWRFRKFSTRTYLRYRNDHPDSVKNNAVNCFKCGSTRISVRGLMNHTYHREHLCTQCGTTLYYSPEE